MSPALKRQKEGQRQQTRDTPALQLPSSSPALGCVQELAAPLLVPGLAWGEDA